MKLCYKIWLDQNGKAFGAGPYEIFMKIDQHGSLRKAAEELHLSYSKAWRIVNMVEERLGFRFVEREAGGSCGGGSRLTEEGRRFVQRYALFMSEAEECLKRAFEKHFAG
ncbi:MAG: LysR family transcriptional regulator [Peptococcaceae bacterium]|jgi:molybdate transport system regulatory protein|nr:LysR family transcriptional regulator [Peptococcaceae bacterium]MDH7524592.1 LysR family transcriptional regulator [Peptococcaceae bacterium]